MATVRCGTCNLPYNDQNPRGCPRCSQEGQGRQRDATIMQQLARASQRLDAEPMAPSRPAISDMLSERFSSAWGSNAPQRLFALALVILVALTVGVLWFGRPSFVAEIHPTPFAGEPRPFAVMPGQPVSVLFSILGTQQPRPHPTDGATERYSYGANLEIDAINGTIYGITMAVPNRTWRGLRTGMTEREAEGTLALRGTPIRGGVGSVPPPELLNEYLVYRSLDARPLRTLTAEVRPPNGCYDIIAELQPRAIGILRRNERRYAVVGNAGDAMQWVVTRVRVVDRSRRGPVDVRAC